MQSSLVELQIHAPNFQQVCSLTHIVTNFSNTKIQHSIRKNLITPHHGYGLTLIDDPVNQPCAWA